MKMINKPVFWGAIILLAIMVVAVGMNVGILQTYIGKAYDFLIDQFGWFFILSSLLLLVFSLFIAFGPYKNVRLGGKEAAPAFGKISWAAMMFTTSCGAWLIVYGFLEPIYCAMDPAFQLESLSVEALEIGQMYAHFHWGPSAWCIYVPISIAIGYLIYNRHKANAGFSDACLVACNYTENPKSTKVFSIVIDIIAVISAVLAPVISIGTGMPLLTALIQDLFALPRTSEIYIQVVILAIWSLIFGISVFFGLRKGIKRLSNINVISALVLMVIVGGLAGVKYVFSEEINTIGLLLQKYLRVATYTDPYGDGAFVRGWTSSYWACYFVYMPLMGIFNAKISKGRTLKELVFGQLVLCSLGCWFAMATFGNYGMKLIVEGTVPVADILRNQGEAAAIMSILQAMPFSKILTVFLLCVCFIFLATTMDSSAFAAAEITFKRTNESQLAPRWLRILWAVAASVISFVLLQIGGFKVVRSLCYLAGLPIAILSYLVMAGVYKMLKVDKENNAMLHSEKIESAKH